MPTRCFLIEPTGMMQRYLRRYAEGPCTNKGEHSYHEAKNLLDVVPVNRNERGNIPAQDHPSLSHPAWPVHCSCCAYEFKGEDNRQVWTEEFYKRTDTGDEFLLSAAPAGAMWFVDYQPDEWKGPDGRSLIVRLPNGRDWSCDGPANNCTKPKDKVHRCWIRHGVAPVITVDKNGNTCSAGAGSILSGNWHGFLVNGILKEC